MQEVLGRRVQFSVSDVVNRLNRSDRSGWRCFIYVSSTWLALLLRKILPSELIVDHILTFIELEMNTRNLESRCLICLFSCIALVIICKSCILQRRQIPNLVHYFPLYPVSRYQTNAISRPEKPIVYPLNIYT